MKQTRFVGHLDWELYRKIIADLKGFDQPLSKLKLYCDGEPLANPRFSDMVHHAKQSGWVDKVTTTTNAVRLNPDLNRQIVASGLDQMNISIYGMSDRQYEQFTKSRVNFGKLVDNISDLFANRGHCEIKIKINGDVISREDEARFYEIFEPIADGVNVEHVMACWVQNESWNLANQGLQPNPNLGIHGQPLQDTQVCPYVFYAFTIHPDGSASACFLDWQRRLLIGDVRTESLKEIWEGRALREHQAMMLRGERRQHPICGTCGQMTHGVVPQDNIDNQRVSLQQKFVQLRMMA